MVKIPLLAMFAVFKGLYKYDHAKGAQARTICALKRSIGLNRQVLTDAWGHDERTTSATGHVTLTEENFCGIIKRDVM